MCYRRAMRLISCGAVWGAVATLVACVRGSRPHDARDFDHRAAIRVLGDVSIDECRALPGVGRGDMSITFHPEGHVSNVVVDAAYARGPIGPCVTRKFSEVRVPSFYGLPVTIRRTFTIH